jgi:hypothetical protein
MVNGIQLQSSSSLTCVKDCVASYYSFFAPACTDAAKRWKSGTPLVPAQFLVTDAEIMVEAHRRLAAESEEREKRIRIAMLRLQNNKASNTL